MSGALWSLPESHLKALTELGVTRTFPKNAIIISVGDRADTMYIILSGRVKVYLSDDAGKEIQLRAMGPGEYFGELVLDDGVRSANVMTLEQCKFSVVTIDQFRDFMANNPAAAFDLIKSYAGRIRELTRQIGDLALLDVYGRVARLLLDMATEEDGKMKVPEKLTQQDIASRVGCSREMVSRIFKDLRAGGYIQMDGERMVIAKKPPKAW